MLRKADLLDTLAEFLLENHLMDDFHDFVVFKKNIEFEEIGFKDYHYGKDNNSERE